MDEAIQHVSASPVRRDARAAQRASGQRSSARRAAVQQALDLGPTFAVSRPGRQPCPATPESGVGAGAGAGAEWTGVQTPGVQTPAPRHRAPWTDDEEAWLQIRLDEDCDYATIARELGRSRRACFQRAYIRQMVIGSPVCMACAAPITQPDVGPRRLFCDGACAYRYQRPLQMIRCGHCGEDFTQTRYKQQYCTNKCAGAASDARQVQVVNAKGRPTFGQRLDDECSARVCALFRAEVSVRGICRETGYGFRQVRSALQRARLLPPAGSASVGASVGGSGGGGQSS